MSFFAFCEIQTTTPRLHWFVACYVLLLTEIVRGLWSVTLEGIEFGTLGAFRNSPRKNRIAYEQFVGLNL